MNMYHDPRHKVFVSYHHEDQRYKDRFIELMGSDMVDESVGFGDIDDTNLSTETIRQYVRDGFIRDATVTIVLIGRCTWQRKHVDWEISSSIRKTPFNTRCGLMGIFLPSHPNFGSKKYAPKLTPPRLADNCVGLEPYASLHNWTENSDWVRSWIDNAYERRDYVLPSNSRDLFGRNRSGSCMRGWSD